MIRTWVVGGLTACCLAAVVAQGQQPPQAQPPQQTQSGPSAGQAEALRPQVNAAMVTRGELKFHQNCSRCHNAPQELSPRISGTVVMHMRVRASLSEADARAILRYLAP